MRVMFYTSPFNFYKANGGKTVLLKTQESLERAGVRVDLWHPTHDDLTKYDVVHCFTMESADMWWWVRGSGRPLAVTPISWFGIYTTPRSRLVRGLKRRLRKKLHCPLHAFYWEECFGYPDVFFPNTAEQGRQLQVAFGVAAERSLVVYHGVDDRFAAASPAPFREEYGIRDDFVLCVARFEERKNQLSLIRALKGTGLPVVFVGRPDSARLQWYYDRCVAEAAPTMRFIWELPHDSPLLASAYAAARVVVLPSYLEAPGLAGLEAGLAGTNVAVTSVGGTAEYFGAHATYLDPRSLRSIRDAVFTAYEAPRPNLALQAHIRANFGWEHVIKRNIEGYKRIAR